MKNIKRIACLLMVVAMILAMAITVSADNDPVTTGSILVKDNESVLASQKTFAAYKILDLTIATDENGAIKSYDYTVPANMADFYATRYGLDKAASEFSAQVADKIREENDIYTFVKAVLASVTPEAFTGAAVENGYKFSNLPLGYYVIQDTTTEGDYIKPVSALILDTATPNVEIEVKADKPEIDKVIDDDNNLDTTDDRVDANEAAIGDTITYVLTSQVPDMVGYTKYFFIMRDQMSKGLTYADNMQITVGNKVLTADVDYSLTKVENTDGTTDLKIVFNDFLQYNTAAFIGAPIEVTYTATLNKDCELGTIANTNEVYLQYSNNPSIEYNGENEPTPEEELANPLGQTPTIRVETFSTALELFKIDPLGIRLTGAEFTLAGEALNTVRVETDSFTLDANGAYWKLKDGSFTTTDPDSTIDGNPVNKDTYESTTDKYAKTTTVSYVETPENVTVTGAVGEDGVLRFEGLSAGTYTITEIKAPDGYNMLTENLNVTITWDAENGFQYEGATDANGVAHITVINQTGSELPSTGGIGTTIFYIIGGLLVLAAVVLLVTRKRMHTAN